MMGCAQTYFFFCWQHGLSRFFLAGKHMATSLDGPLANLGELWKHFSIKEHYPYDK